MYTWTAQRSKATEKKQKAKSKQISDKILLPLPLPPQGPECHPGSPWSHKPRWERTLGSVCGGLLSRSTQSIFSLPKGLLYPTLHTPCGPCPTPSLQPSLPMFTLFVLSTLFPASPESTRNPLPVIGIPRPSDVHLLRSPPTRNPPLTVRNLWPSDVHLRPSPQSRNPRSHGALPQLVPHTRPCLLYTSPSPRDS